MADFGDLLKEALVDSGGKIEDKTDENNPGVTEPTKPERTEQQNTDVSFDISAFNKKFSKEFKDENSLVEYIDKASKYDEVNSKFEELSKRYEEVETLAKRNVNPLEWFKDQDEFIKQQFLKNKASQFSEEAVNSLVKLTPSSIDKMNAWDALKLQMLVDNPDLEGGEAGVVELLQDKYGLDDEDWDSFDTRTKNRIKLDAKDAKEGLKGLFADIKIPEAVDFATSSKQLKETWGDPLNEIVKGIDKIKLSEDFEFSVSEDMKAELVEELMDEVLTSHIKPSTEAGAKLAAAARSKILERNMDKVISSIAKTVEAKAEEKWMQKLHNSNPLNNTTGSGGHDDTAAGINWLING